MKFLMQATSGSLLDLGGGWRVETAFGRLRLLSRVGPPSPPLVPVSGQAGELEWGGWHLAWTRETAPETHPREGMTAWFIPQELSVRGWRAGDRLAPLQGRGSRLVVKCFQEAKVPSTRRARWPIVETLGRVVWIPGVCRSADLVPAYGAEALRIDVAPF